MKSSFLLLLILCLLLGGCAKKTTSIVGTWKYIQAKSPGNNVTYVFNADHTYSLSEHAVYQLIRSHQSASGTYYVQNGVLTINTDQEDIGLDSSSMAAIEAREKKLNPKMHIQQDSSDVPVKIEQPMMVYLYSISSDDNYLKLKDTSNAADVGHLYARQRLSN